MNTQNKTILKALLISLSFTVLAVLSLNIVFAQDINTGNQPCISANSSTLVSNILVANACD